MIGHHTTNASHPGAVLGPDHSFGRSTVVVVVHRLLLVPSDWRTHRPCMMGERKVNTHHMRNI